MNQFGETLSVPVPQLVQDLYSDEKNNYAKLISSAFRTNIPVETLVGLGDIYEHLILPLIYPAIFEGPRGPRRVLLEFLILDKGYRPSLVLKLLDPVLWSNFNRFFGDPSPHEFLNFLQGHPQFKQFFPE